MDMPILDRMKTADERLRAELGRVVMGQDEAVDHLLTALFAGGHCLLHGDLATGKTLLATSLAQTLSLSARRIQFTPDLMPADITGSEILEEDSATGRREARFVPGPVFCHLLMADEINRTPPKTQSALLEAMQERQVSHGGVTRPLPRPFHVFATQTAVEQEGVYPLPEAQQDRFLLSVRMDAPDPEAELAALRLSTGPDRPALRPVLDADELAAFQDAVRDIHLPEPLVDHIVAVVDASRPGRPGAPAFVNEYVQWGAGLRASQTVALCAKARAARRGRSTVSPEDAAALFVPALRHRIGLTFRAEAERVTPEDLVRRLVESLPFGSR